MTEHSTPSMPDLAHPTHGFHHTVDSALAIMSHSGVPSSRITIRMAGLGWPVFWVVEQSPPAGSPLTPDVHVALSVAGLGFFHELPVGMWDSGGEAEPGTREIVELLDDSVQKAAHWIRGGASLFDVQPQNRQACSRWISLFGLNPDDWPVQDWYGLAVLLPSLHRLAGKEAGVRLALQTVFRLPLAGIPTVRSFSYMEDDELTLLGTSANRLGMDFIVGDRVEDFARLVPIIGPVTLKTYCEFQAEENARRLDSVLQLCLPCYQKYSISWLVLHPDRAPRLGQEQENARLGINSWLGRGARCPEGEQPSMPHPSETGQQEFREGSL